MKKENTNSKGKLICIGLATFIITLGIGACLTATTAGETPESCEELMQEYNVDSFDELINYGH